MKTVLNREHEYKPVNKRIRELFWTLFIKLRGRETNGNISDMREVVPYEIPDL